MTNNDSVPPPVDDAISRVVDVTKDGLKLVQQELQLARQETIENLTPVARSSGMILGGGVLAAFGGRYIMDGLVRLLATIMPHWLASLLSGLGLTAGGLALIRRGGEDIQHINLVPYKTINSLRKDKEWLQQQIKSKLI